MGYVLRLFDNLQHVVKATGMNIGYRNPQRNQPCTILPTGARNTNLSTPAANTWGPWVQITAGLLSDVVIAAAQTVNIVTLSDIYHYQIGTGAIGAEVPIIEFEVGTFVQGTATPIPGRTTQLPYVHIPAGTRLSARVYDENAGGNSGNASLYLYVLPYGSITWDTWDDRYAKGDRSQGSFRTPAVASPYINLAGGNPGAWSTIIAAAAQECLVTAIQCNMVTSPQWAQLEIGIGAAGAEIIQERVGKCSSQTLIATWGYNELCRLVRVHTNERIAMRIASEASVASIGVAMTIENILP